VPAEFFPPGGRGEHLPVKIKISVNKNIFAKILSRHQRQHMIFEIDIVVLMLELKLETCV